MSKAINVSLITVSLESESLVSVVAFMIIIQACYRDWMTRSETKPKRLERRKVMCRRNRSL